MSHIRTHIGQQLEVLADKVLLGAIPLLAIFMAVALIKVG
jgi:hypothetical protein